MFNLEFPLVDLKKNWNSVSEMREIFQTDVCECVYATSCLRFSMFVCNLRICKTHELAVKFLWSYVFGMCYR